MSVIQIFTACHVYVIIQIGYLSNLLPIYLHFIISQTRLSVSQIFIAFHVCMCIIITYQTNVSVVQILT